MLNFIELKRPHIFCIIESDLHSIQSRYNKSTYLTSQDIYDRLKIENYQIYLPQSWDYHGQARIFLYTHVDLKIKVRNFGIQYVDLPMITIEVGLGLERKTIINFFYREFTGGVSGCDDMTSQRERLSRMINVWNMISNDNRDSICLGDVNLCGIKWSDHNYCYRELSDMVQTYLLETDSCQLVQDYTRSEIVRGNQLSQSMIDHCYTNVPTKITKPEVLAIGNSDHLGVFITKYSKDIVSRPKMIKKRSYKKFMIEDFLTDIHRSEINTRVTALNDLEVAASEFQSLFSGILNRHAPVKIFQARKNYLPYFSQDTKSLIKEKIFCSKRVIERSIIDQNRWVSK